MTSSAITLLGYALIGAAACALEIHARSTGRVSSFGDAVAALLRHRLLRVLVLAAWLWLGWHLFVRVDWR